MAELGPGDRPDDVDGAETARRLARYWSSHACCSGVKIAGVGVGERVGVGVGVRGRGSGAFGSRHGSIVTEQAGQSSAVVMFPVLEAAERDDWLTDRQMLKAAPLVLPR